MTKRGYAEKPLWEVIEEAVTRLDLLIFRENDFDEPRNSINVLGRLGDKTVSAWISRHELAEPNVVPSLIFANTIHQVVEILREEKKDEQGI